MWIETGRLRIYISFLFALFFTVAANTSSGRAYVLMMICALFHEGVHIILLFFCGCENICLRLRPGGIAMESEGFELLSYKETVLCTLVPPVVNIFSGVIFYGCYIKVNAPVLYELSVVNIMLGAGNILPFSFLDGGRALNSVLSAIAGPHKADSICDFISVIVLIFLGILLFYIVATGKHFLFAVCFFFYCLSGYVSGKTKGGIT